jgi:hypothetical protein
MLDDDLSAYFLAVSSLRSGDPSVRRPALAALLELARGSKGPVQLRAERAVAKEFGPYAVREGLSGCAAPMEAVLACCDDDRECRSCPWQWKDEQTEFDAQSALGGLGHEPKVTDDIIAS